MGSVLVHQLPPRVIGDSKLLIGVSQPSTRDNWERHGWKKMDRLLDCVIVQTRIDLTVCLLVVVQRSAFEKASLTQEE